MPKTIEPKLRKISEYLTLDKETIFVIPEYQRAYTWTVAQCDKLWQDILNQMESESSSQDNYFFGTIIINCQDNDRKMVLIDGQQRTTTFILLLKALLIHINSAIESTKKDEESASLCRVLRAHRTNIMKILYKGEIEDILETPDKDKDSTLFRKNSNFIVENNSINEKDEYRGELKTILFNYDYKKAEEEAAKIKYKQKDNKYTNFFRNYKFFYEKADSLSPSELNRFTKKLLDECEVIEIKSWRVEQAIAMFNSLNADGMPLCDSDIIASKLYAAAKEQGCDKNFSESWSSLQKLATELEQTGIGTLDSILMQHMYYTRAYRKETMRANTNTINVTTPGLRRYYIDINKELLTDPNHLCDRLINLAKIWLKVYDYPLTRVLLKFNDNARLFLSSYFYRFDEDTVTEEKLQTISECMLRLFTVLEIVDKGFSSVEFKTFLFQEEIKLADKNCTEQEIKADFDYHINAKWTREDLIAQIKEYDGVRLVYLNEYLFAKKHNHAFQLISNLNIEHIMPASGKNILPIRIDAGIENEEEFKEKVNKLGNKILLEEKLNKALGNEWFRTKVSSKLEDKTGYINSSYPIAQALVKRYQNDSKPYWTKDDIDNATAKASERIVNFIFGD